MARADLSVKPAAADIERDFCNLDNFVIRHRSSIGVGKLGVMMLARAIMTKFQITSDVIVQLPLAQDNDKERKHTKKVGNCMPKRLYKLQCRQMLAALEADEDAEDDHVLRSASLG